MKHWVMTLQLRDVLCKDTYWHLAFDARALCGWKKNHSPIVGMNTKQVLWEFKEEVGGCAHHHKTSGSTLDQKSMNGLD